MINYFIYHFMDFPIRSRLRLKEILFENPKVGTSRWLVRHFFSGVARIASPPDRTREAACPYPPALVPVS